jgi:hypothetical protein
MRDILGVVYISKRAAVASIRAMPAAADAGHPLFYTVKEFTQETIRAFIRAGANGGKKQASEAGSRSTSARIAFALSRGSQNKTTRATAAV